MALAMRTIGATEMANTARRALGPPVLEAHHVTKTYPARGAKTPPVLANSDLSLTVHAGEIVALLGPNGAGKSTFLKQLAGQLLPSSGSIQIGGIDMITDPKRAKEVLSVVPQESQPLSNLTVEEHVRYFGLIKGSDRRTARAETESILRAVGLHDVRDKLVHDLSGGSKRRVMFAVAMAGASPQLLLLDEPTTGLDPEARRSVWAVMESLRDRGLAVLLTTHYIEEAEELADRVVIIAHSRFVAEGTVASLRARLPYGGKLDVLGIDRASPEAKAQLIRMERLWRVSLRTPTRLRFEVPDPYSTDTVERLAEVSRLGMHATLAASSLEDAYLEVVGEVGEES